MLSKKNPCCKEIFKSLTCRTVQLHKKKTYMLFAGREVRMVKTCDRGLENAARGQHFQARGHSFSPYGPTLSRQIHVYFFFLHEIGFTAHKWVCLRNSCH